MRATRIDALDGFRALAILMVMAFHYYANPTQFQDVQMLYPFGVRFAESPFTRYGHLGVNLFFIISGFVIAMTLESTRTWTEFAVKRFARLFPAMLLCTLITFFSLDLLPQRAWRLHAVDLLPGLTFISDFTWRGWLGPDIAIVEIVYWTLFVEVKFYILAAALFFTLRRMPLLMSLAVVLNVVWLLTRTPHEYNPILKSVLSYDFLPWFLAGIAFHSLNQGKFKLLSMALVLECLVMLVTRMRQGDRIEIAWTLAFFALFFALVYRPQWLRWASWRPLSLIGVSSYSLYLLHNRLGISLTHAMAPHVPEWFWPVLPVLVGTAMVGLALGIHRWWERPVNAAILARFGGASKWRTGVALAPASP